MAEPSPANEPNRPARAVDRRDGERARRPVVGLVAHDPGVPSFRLRMLPLRAALERDGVDGRVVALGRGTEWLRVLRLAREWRRCDLLVFQQVKLLAGERAFVRQRCPSWVLDVDDAIMFARPRRPGDPPSQAWWRRRRFDRMAAASRVVVAGSESLTRALGPGIERAIVLPSPVDLAAHPVAPLPDRRPVRLGWIGLASNLLYLESLAPALRRLSAEGVAFELRVVSSRPAELPGVPAVFVPWSVLGEGAALADCDVGLAPLADDAWTRGKAGFRCIQYAAAGLPTVASPVGANREVVVEGETGTFAGTPEEWLAALRRLAADHALRVRLGHAARARAARYDVGAFVSRYLEALRPLLAEAMPGVETLRN